jgi:hypothetical protein
MNLHRSVVRGLLLTLLLSALSAASFGQIGIGISVRVGPPALPVYAQPICPGPGYLWTPGYWAWNEEGGYYFVPGTWVVAPVGMLWTPGYWGYAGGFYGWHGGYWGPHIGFYGGINYGYGYGGTGFYGGEWRGGGFYYNRSVTNVSVTNVTNVYNKTVVVNENHTSFNGGEGGIAARPSPQEEAAEHEHHMAPIAAQQQHETLAAQNRQNFASENHGRPAIAATSKAGDFSSRSAVPARAAGGEYHAPAMSPREARGPSTPGNAGAGNHPGGATPEKGPANGGFRPFTPPSSNGGANAGANAGNKTNNPTYNDHGAGATNPVHEPANNASAPTAPHNTGGNAPGGNNMNKPAPQGQHKASPPPQHKPNNPPKEERKERDR